MSERLPSHVVSRLPPDLDESALRAWVALPGGPDTSLGETFVLVSPPRLVALVKQGAVGGLEAVELDPDRPPRVAERRWDQAIELTRRSGEAIQLPLPSTGREDALERLCAVLRATGDDDALRDVLESRLAARLDPTRAAAVTLELAELLARLGEDDAAMGRYAEILELRPDHAGALAGLERLAERAEDPRPLAALLVPRYERAGRWDAAARLRLRALPWLPPEARRTEAVALANVFERRLDAPRLALDALLPALQLDPDDGEISRHVERLASADASWVGTLERLTRAAGDGETSAPDRLWARVAAWREEHLDDVAGAEAAWREVVAQDPQRAEAWAALGRLAELQDRPEAAVAAWERELALEPGPARTVELYVGLGWLKLERLGDPERAEAAFRGALALRPMAEGALEGLDVLFMQQGRWSDLYELLNARADREVDRAERVAIGKRLAGLARDRLDDSERALAHWHKVRAAVPEDAEAFEAIRELLAGAERWRELAGLLEEQLGAWGDAEATLRISAQRQLARVLQVRLGELERARAVWEAVLAVAPRDPEALRGVVACWPEGEAPERYARMVATLLEVLPADAPDLATLWTRLATAHRGAGDTDAERDAWHEVVALEPEDAGAWRRLRELARAAGDRERHLEAASALVSLVPPDERAALQAERAELLEATGRRGDAAEAWAAVFEAAPSESVASRLRTLYAALGMWREALDLELRVARGAEGEVRVEHVLRAADIADRQLLAAGRALELLAEALPAAPEDERLLRRAAELGLALGRWQALLDVVPPTAAGPLMTTLEREAADRPERVTVWRSLAERAEGTDPARAESLWLRAERAEEALRAEEAARKTRRVALILTALAGLATVATVLAVAFL